MFFFVFFFSLAVVFLLFGDPLCLWGGCSDLGLHEQGHGEWLWLLFPSRIACVFSQFFWSSSVLRSPRSWSTSTILRTSRPWMSQDLPAKMPPSRFWMCFTTRYVRTWNHLLSPTAFKPPVFFFIFQLDCCGKGDDTALFKQVVGTLCPRKSVEDFLKSQVSSKHTFEGLGI